MITPRYQEKDIVEGIITSVKKYGVFLSFDGAYSGLLHISEISNNFVNNIQKYFHCGDVIKVYVKSVDENTKFLSVSLKRLPEELNVYKEISPSKKITSYLRDIDFKKLGKSLPKMIEEELNREKKLMSLKVSFDYVGKKNLAPFQEYEERVRNIHDMINDHTGLGSDYLGWLDWPTNYDKDEVTRMLKKAMEFQTNYETLVVCGIGGSYLGARACIEALAGSFNEQMKMEVLYFGNTLDPNYSYDLLDHIKNKKFCVCVISKSGTTTETSVSFRILKEMLEKKLGKEKAKDAIVAVTDKEKGALKTLADKEGYETYVLPGNIGGRFSVITPVGLFPIACAGIDINALLAGCRDAQKEYDNPNIYENKAYQYAVERNFLYNSGYSVEMLCSYEPRLKMLNEWWKQLFDESEGKASKAVLTSSCTFTTDLHSLGQFIQDGSKILYETTIYINHPTSDVTVPYDEENLDELNYLAGKKLSYINEKAYIGTLKAHSEHGGVPNITINLDTLDARSLGHLLYFFMKACAMSAYLLGVNPFNQPGVEIYKKNMFHLLGKKGY